MKTEFYLLDQQGVMTGPLTAEGLLQLGSLDGFFCSTDRQTWYDAPAVVQQLSSPAESVEKIGEFVPESSFPMPPPAQRQAGSRLEHFAAVLMQMWNPAEAEIRLHQWPAGRNLSLSLLWLTVVLIAIAVEYCYFAPLLGEKSRWLLLSGVVTGAIFLLTAAAVTLLAAGKRITHLLTMARLLLSIAGAAALSLALAPGVIHDQGWLRGLWLLPQLLIWGWFGCRIIPGLKIQQK